MPNKQHLAILKQGAKVWNTWRERNSAIQPQLSHAILYRRTLCGVDLSNAILHKTDLRDTDLRRANLVKASLVKADLYRADLRNAILVGTNLHEAELIESNLCESNLCQVHLYKANLRHSNLSRADLSEANLQRADLSGANLCGANLVGCNLTCANLSDADLSEANLTFSLLVETNFTRANLTNCRVYGSSAWRLTLEEAKQSDIIITSLNEPTITVDSLEVAQFIYLLLNNERVRDVINTITTKVVLVLGRFVPERKSVLEAIRDELRKRNYLPVLFDFDKPASRDITETVSTLAHLSRFIIADITDPRSIPQELQTIVPDLPSVPIQPLLLSSQREYGMFEHFTRFPWVLPIHHYNDLDDLLASLADKVIAPAEAKAKELQPQ